MAQTISRNAEPVASAPAASRSLMRGRLRRILYQISARENRPTLIECALACLSALLLSVSFPDFDFSFLAWCALAPLMFAVVRRPRVAPMFFAGWLAGALFFYATCWWLTYAMIHYGGIPSPLAYLLFAPATLIVGVFPALFAATLARLCKTFGVRGALIFAPFLWTATEWLRLQTTGQLWNALGYSQAFHPTLIQAARFGGVYAVGFFIVAANAALTALLFTILNRRRDEQNLNAQPVEETNEATRNATTRIHFIASLGALLCVALALFATDFFASRPPRHKSDDTSRALVIAVQPNVAPDFSRTDAEYNELLRRHFVLTARGFDEARRKFASTTTKEANVSSSVSSQTLSDGVSSPHLVVFPESPMNFSYANDAGFRAVAQNFARENHASLLFNSLEPAPNQGAYNAAVMIDADGRRVAQYAKIRMVPFGEYNPLPKWFPLAWVLGAIVGDFTPGAQYTLMPVVGSRTPEVRSVVDKTSLRVGVSICVESAYPEIAREFARGGADALINITNDGYLGKTPVLRQHLANGVFRAIENSRPLLSVTNTGITALITPRGEVTDATESYTTDVRAWQIEKSDGAQTFYTRFGDLFAWLCVAVGALALLIRRNSESRIQGSEELRVDHKEQSIGAERF